MVPVRGRGTGDHTLRFGPQHGHGIGVAIRASSDDVLQIEHGSLYPALHRLEKQGFIDAEWKITEHKQRAKYYRLTPAGRRQLVTERTRWTTARMVWRFGGARVR